MKHLRILVVLCISTVIFQSCKDPVVDPVEKVIYGKGAYVVNEGAFLAGNGSISYFSTETSAVQRNIFKTQNERGLGDVVQSFYIKNDKGYVVVNNSKKLEIVNINTFKSIKTIDGLYLPRYFTAVSSSKGYLTDWGSFDGSIKARIYVLDLASNTITKTIELGSFLGSDQLAVNGNKAYILNNFTNSVSILDITTDQVLATVEVGDAPTSISVDKNGKVWILCSGSYGDSYTTTDDDTMGKLVEIKADNTVGTTFEIGVKGDHPSNMAINGTKDLVYFLNSGKILKVNTTNESLSSVSFKDGYFYGLSVNSATNNIYTLDAKDYKSNGECTIYNPTGEKLTALEVELIPNNVVFNN